MTQCIFVYSLTFLDNLSLLISPIYTTSYTLWYNTESEIKYDKFQKKNTFLLYPEISHMYTCKYAKPSIARYMQFCK